MGHRQSEHHGWSEDGTHRIPPTNDTTSDAVKRAEAIVDAQEARDITEAIDEDEGYDRQDGRNLHRE